MKGLERLMQDLPELGAYGFGVFENSRLSSVERQVKLAEEREELLRLADRVEATVEWIDSHLHPSTKICKIKSSYGLKHIVERDIGYIPNGVFIAAAILSGADWRRCHDTSPNAYFNFTRTSIEEEFERVNKRRFG